MLSHIDKILWEKDKLIESNTDAMKLLSMKKLVHMYSVNMLYIPIR